jgi:hypothetical protein
MNPKDPEEIAELITEDIHENRGLIIEADVAGPVGPEGAAVPAPGPAGPAESKIMADRQIGFSDFDEMIGVNTYPDGAKMYIGHSRPAYPYLLIKPDGSRWRCDEKAMVPLERYPVNSPSPDAVPNPYDTEPRDIMAGTEEELMDFLVTAGNKDDISFVGPGMTPEEAQEVVAAHTAAESEEAAAEAGAPGSTTGVDVNEFPGDLGAEG